MRSFQEKVSSFTENTANLLIQISELNELRERLKSAQQSAERVRQSSGERTPIEHSEHP
jgi:hypothetical protein